MAAEPPHVSAGELDGFARGAVAPERLLAIDAHLQTCEPCAALVRADATARLAAACREITAPPDTHVAADLLEAYVNGTLGEADLEAVGSHVELCPLCAEDAADLRSVAAEAPLPSRARSVPRKAIWAVIGGVAAVLLLFVVPARKPPAPAAPTVPDAASAPPRETLADGARTLRVEADGRISGASFVGDEDRLLVAALRDRQLDLPPSSRDFLARPGTLLGPETASAFGVAAPVATAVADTRPRFEWLRHRAARRYRVEVFDPLFSRVLRSPWITATAWTADRDLVRGRLYLWQVAADTPAGEVRAPVPPAAEARFEVLDDRRAAAAAGIARRHAGAPLTLGILEAHLGLLDRAERHLTEAAAANPGSATVKTLRATVTRARTGGATDRR